MRDIDWEEVEKLRVELGELIDRDDLPSEHHGKFSRISKILSRLDEINTGYNKLSEFRRYAQNFYGPNQKKKYPMWKYEQDKMREFIVSLDSYIDMMKLAKENELSD